MCAPTRDVMCAQTRDVMRAQTRDVMCAQTRDVMFMRNGFWAWASVVIARGFAVSLVAHDKN